MFSYYLLVDVDCLLIGFDGVFAAIRDDIKPGDAQVEPGQFALIVESRWVAIEQALADFQGRAISCFGTCCSTGGRHAVDVAEHF